MRIRIRHLHKQQFIRGHRLDTLPDSGCLSASSFIEKLILWSVDTCQEFFVIFTMSVYFHARALPHHESVGSDVGKFGIHQHLDEKA